MDRRELKFRSWNGEMEMMCRPVDLSSPLQDYRWLGRGDNPIMQYTGLLDKNGKEIYEGDIVKYKYLHGFACDFDENFREDKNVSETIDEVKFFDGEFLPREKHDQVKYSYYSQRYFDFEVIGNIYENPELLKK